MSTKTTFKRVALVAVASLGFGVLPATSSSAAIALGDVTAMTLTKTSGASQVNAAVKVKLGATFGTVARASGADTYPFKATLTTFPSAGAATVTTDISTDTPTAPTGIALAARAVASVELVDDIDGANPTTDDKAVITFAAAHGILQGDSVTVAGLTDNDGASTGDFAQINGTRTVASVTATTITINLAAVAADHADGAASAGTVALPAVANTVSNSGATLNVVRTTLAGITAGTYADLGEYAFTPLVAGTYVLTGWYDSDGNGLLTVGETTQTLSISVSSLAVASTDFPDSSNTAGDLYVSNVGISTTSPSGRVGVPVGFAPGFKLTNGPAGTAATTTETSQRAKLVYAVTNPAGTAVLTHGVATGQTALTVDGGAQYVAAANANNPAAAATLANSTEQSLFNLGSVSYFTPATAGTYTVTIYHDGGGVNGTTSLRNDLRTAAEAVASYQIVVVADGLPSLTGTVYGSTFPARSATGVLVKLSLKNGTAASSLAPNEVLTLTAPTNSTFNAVSLMTGTTFAMNGTASTNATQTLTSANFDGSGNAYVKVGNSTAAGGTFTVTGNISGGTANGAAGSFTFTVIDTTVVAGVSGRTVNSASTESILNAKDLLGVAGASVLNATEEWSVKRGAATTVSATIATTTKAELYRATVTDTLGLLTGMAGATYDITASTSITVAPTKAAFSLAIPATTSLVPSGTRVASIAFDTAGGNEAINVSAADSTATYFYSNPTATANAYTLRAGAATTNKFTISVTDQFGSAIAGSVMTAAVTGRNSTVVYPTFVTNASGEFEVSLTDSYTGTFLLTDTITVSSGGVAKASVTVNYATYLPAATITMTTPDSATAAATGIAGTKTTDVYSEGSLAGAEGGAVDVKAVLKDANGATLPAGVPVTFAVSGNAGSAILSTHVTVLTGADGSATTKVYGWTNGNTVVTATSGAATASGTVYFKQADAVSGAQAEARTITAKASGNVVTATVTDRFGNPIKGINVVASRVGTGTFNGTSSLTGITDKAGQVQFVLTNGTADVTVAFETATFGQSYATKGYIDAGVTAILAYTAGTVALAEEGVGASFDAAGVNSATVLAVTDTATLDQATAATDAAAEATDAANAATDAANAAAEAADAATAAAQDAADAVAALSTQVSEMVNALKKQITALTNLVIKIQKKVKA